MVQLDSVPCGCCNGIAAPLQTDWVGEEAPHPRQLCPQTRVLRKVDIEVVPRASSLVLPRPSCRWWLVVAAVAVATVSERERELRCAGMYTVQGAVYVTNLRCIISFVDSSFLHSSLVSSKALVDTC